MIQAVESLLSTHGKEAGMLCDYHAAVKAMARFSFEIRPDEDGDTAAAADLRENRRSRGPVARSNWLMWPTPQASGTL